MNNSKFQNILYALVIELYNSQKKKIAKIVKLLYKLTVLINDSINLDLKIKVIY